METSFPEPQDGMNTSWLAMSRFRRRHYASSIEICTNELKTAPRDELNWFIKARAMTQMVYVDDTEESVDLDDEGVLDIDNLVVGTRAANVSRLGLKSRAGTARGTARRSRLGSSFARTGGKRHVQGSRAGSRMGTQAGGNRPISMSGRFLRPGTAALLTGGDGMFVDVAALRPGSFSDKPAIARVLVDYLLYHELNPRAALSILTLLHDVARGNDNWVKARLAKCYSWLGLYRESDNIYNSASQSVDWPFLVLEHAIVLLRLRQPKRCLELLVGALTVPTLNNERCFYTALGRLYQLLHDDTNCIAMHKLRLLREPVHVESQSSLAAHCYYEGYSERALRLYQRISCVIPRSSALQNNLALSAYQAGQHDVALMWLRQALAGADDLDAADIFYNVGCVGLFVGEESLTLHGFRCCIALNPHHSEAQNNLGVLELKNTRNSRAANCAAARPWLESATEADPTNLDALINLSVTYRQLGLLEKAYACATAAQQLEPEMADARTLVAELETIFTHK